jgi:hypothetical protein
MNKNCSIKNCNKKVKSKGLCSMHYERARIYGDVNREVKQGTIHGLKKNLFYQRWKSIRQRCTNENSKAYKNYGCRGISLSVEFNDPVVFVEYISGLENCGIKGLTLDRIDNDKGYERGNLRWVNRSIQTQNQRISLKNKTGYKGVYIYRNGFRAIVVRNKKYNYLGDFKTKEEANGAIINFLNK